MLIFIVLLIVGFVVLIKGADWFVDGASSLAANFKVPKIIIALTIVSFGTSAPELAVAFKSMISGNTDMVLGNVIGSNILNILLILGLASMFHNLEVKSNTVKKEIPIVILISTLLVVLMNDNWFDSGVLNVLTRSDGIVILLFFMVFIYYLIYVARRGHYEDEKPRYKVGISIFLTVIGILLVIFGSNLVVNNAVSIASMMGVSEKFISLTIISIGTSLPELVTSVMAGIKKENDIAIGNIVGSCIFNIGCVLGLSLSLFGNIQILSFDIMDIFMFLLSAVLLFITSAKDNKITKSEGYSYLIIYVIYMIYLLMFSK